MKLNSLPFRSAFDSAGKAIEVTKYTEKLVPSTRFVAVDGVAPKIAPESFVAPSASVIGNVTMGKTSRYVVLMMVLLLLIHSDSTAIETVFGTVPQYEVM